MSGDENSAALSLALESALAAAAEHGRSAASLSDVADSVGRAFDGSAVGGRYTDLGAALATGIHAAGLSIGRWSASSAAVADAVRWTAAASADVDRSLAGGLGEERS
ncbi:hypothetical protein ACNHUS_01725 [Actinomycetes bacterium M1A6_2h]